MDINKAKNMFLYKVMLVSIVLVFKHYNFRWTITILGSKLAFKSRLKM